jgi:protein-tyrosine-phosphatase
VVAKPKKAVNYLNNRDILKEIHKSKTSYCYFIEPEYNAYDLIIDMPESSIESSLEYAITDDQILAAKTTRAARLTQETGEKVLADAIATEDLIFRVMTWDHIPVSQKQPRKTTKKKTAKDIIVFIDDDDSGDFAELEDKTTKAEVDDMVHVKVNFPPFQHFKLDNTNTFRCVGKSHWVGGIENGSFSRDHGNITNKLARMYMMLCEKYAMKFNWRGYTYNDEMKASAVLQLTYVGLRFNEAKSANPFAYYTAAITNSFCRVLNTEKRNQNIRDDILEMNGLNPSFSRQMSGAKVNTIID